MPDSSDSLPPNKRLEVSVGIVITLLETAKDLGITDTDTLLSKAGIDAELLRQQENRIPFEQHERLWEQIVATSGDPNFGLKFGARLKPASHSVLGYIASNSATIGDALNAAEKYQTLSGDGGLLQVQRDDEFTSISFDPVNPEKALSHHRVIGVLSGQIWVGRWLIGDQFQPLQAEFTAPQPDDTAPYEAVFRCPVYFDAQRNCLTYPRAIDQLPIPLASHEILQMLKQKADQTIERLSSQGTFTGEVTRLLMASLIGQEPDKGQIAEQLGMSQRTLQRRLLKEETTYQEILDRTRHRLALDYLAQQELTVSDIAYLLGFTEPSAFYRAFKKWQGIPPGQYRQQL